MRTRRLTNGVSIPDRDGLFPSKRDAMRILVTGGAGFIGSAVIRHCLKNTGHEIVNLDALTYAANLDSLKEVLPNPRYQFEHADICDAAAVERILVTHQPDAVMHLAAESHVD